MMKSVALLATGAAALNLGASHTAKSSLTARLDPASVAQLLVETQQQWLDAEVEAVRSGKGAAAREESKKENTASCEDVTRSIMQASNGDKERVSLYGKDVCSSSTGKGSSASCEHFFAGILEIMTDDAEFNREEVDAAKFCGKTVDAVSDEAVEYVKRNPKTPEALKLEAKKAEDAKKQAEQAKLEIAKKAAAAKKVQEITTIKAENVKLAAEAKRLVSKKKAEVAVAKKKFLDTRAQVTQEEGTVARLARELSAAILPRGAPEKKPEQRKEAAVAAKAEKKAGQAAKATASSQKVETKAEKTKPAVAAQAPKKTVEQKKKGKAVAK
jgi:hypothetical protein